MPSLPLRTSLDRRMAAGLFAVLILAALILFGAVDRIVQLGLVFGLGAGFLLHPPEVPRIPRTWGWIWLGLAGFVVVSQFLPYRCFGQTYWRLVLSHDYEVVFPFTRNPEPGRAVDCILAAFLAVAWFFWVRTLACDRPVRLFLIWALFGAATCVAAVSISLAPRTDFLIYGVRYSPGWTGFGPFPNRNHTAALLAMGALAGLGCLVRAARRQYWLHLLASGVCEIVVLVALIESKSRGGLIGFGCGAALFAVLAITRLRNRNALAGALAGGLLCATLVLSFGSKVLGRFVAEDNGAVSSNLRWQIWQDALRVWKDAPVWGHGLGTFTQIFPLYQTVETHGQIVLHPESSWLLWLDELGAVPVGLGAALLLFFMARNAIGAVRTGDRGFFIRAGAFAGVFGLLCHGFMDVPVHRWGTAAFGIALLAIACPPLHRRRQVQLGRLWAGAPLLLGLFWLLPFQRNPPDWSPEAVRQLLERLAYSPTSASMTQLRQFEAWFPLNPLLHQQIGIREILVARHPDPAWREFRVADRLNPGPWSFPAMQGWLSRDASPGMSFHFWSLAVERAEDHVPDRLFDAFMDAYRSTRDLPGADAYWRNYAEAHPELLLLYAQAASGEGQARAAYDEWWKVRGDSDTGVDVLESSAFYRALRKWGDPARLEIWMHRHPELEAADFKTWAAILHDWQLDTDAWRILSSHIKDPPFPDSNAGDSAQMAEANWRSHPDDPIYAQAYARLCSINGNASRSEQIILSVATGKSPPPWFIEKAAFLYAAKKDYATAVTSLLRLSSTDS